MRGILLAASTRQHRSTSSLTSNLSHLVSRGTCGLCCLTCGLCCILSRPSGRHHRCTCSQPCCLGRIHLTRTTSQRLPASLLTGLTGRASRRCRGSTHTGCVVHQRPYATSSSLSSTLRSTLVVPTMPRIRPIMRCRCGLRLSLSRSSCIVSRLPSSTHCLLLAASRVHHRSSSSLTRDLSCRVHRRSLALGCLTSCTSCLRRRSTMSSHSRTGCLARRMLCLRHLSLIHI